jgi:transcriptional regulator with XRE-family HTH domain
MDAAAENLLGRYLKDRRAKLDPAAFGLPLARRRTPGLRREEVAQRAHVSATWYTWLEQGRGGAPSAGVLERIARALMLTEAERQHLFLLALGRPPEIRFQATEGITPRLQRVLDGLALNPAYVRNSAWDVVAWNRAAAVVLVDYPTLAPEQRNILRLFFLNPQLRETVPNWDTDARYVVAAFRADTARSGAANNVKGLVEEMRRLSPVFDTIWRDNDVRDSYGERPKQVRHRQAGMIALEVSTFAVDGRPDLNLAIYTPSTPADVAKVRALLKSPARTARG